MKKEIYEAQKLAIVDVLISSAVFKNSPLDRLVGICNGCGAAGSWFRPPAKIWGTSIIEACIIHDHAYYTGSNYDDKKEADKDFLDNMLTLIDRRSRWYKPTRFQRWRAKRYYQAVKYYGGAAFRGSK